ncbi:rhamnogalacturonyl hydrolase YesR [Allocatelliglobosispora scoriae]|uniref:Rhamnogalacturonyl hydrolase YesR n=1 Tax=Allocatelliglobosispora scoriae TaxID=643052 RepID=A0A841C391_9ACTN|nr:glycoside hydrolase family 88 protein [Allocatelliglobosispora scoriae]MBB5873779.1 rhamnogalacturonyl hydrolase YesR [Allocatelliglobosispora scoriae]
MDRRTLLRAGTALAGGIGAAGLPGTALAAPGTTLPARSAVLAGMRLVNDYWINGHADPGNNQWARATYVSGTIAAYRATGVASYLTYARNWAQQNNYALNGGTSTRHADNHNAGQAYYDLYEIDGNASHLTAINESIRLMVYGSNTSNTDWWWVDALHMAMPVFVRVANYRNDATYLTKLGKLYDYTKKQISGVGLWNATDRLWYRDAGYIWPNGSGSHSPNGKKVYWSRGNGWALAAHAKVLALLPATDPKRAEYVSTLQALSAALPGIQRADGFWNVNLADAAHRGGPETSGTAFFTYGLAYGIRTGLLPSATYLPVVAKAWNGMVATAVRPSGLLGWVQGVGANPDSSQPVTSTSTSDFGVGAFLLAGSEVAKLTV